GIHVRARGGSFVPFTVGILRRIHAPMKNELTCLPWTSGPYLRVNRASRQVSGVQLGQGAPSGCQRRPWRLAPTPQYLKALREAEQTVTQAMRRGVVLRHKARQGQP